MTLHVLHVITGLNIGGAENMLSRVAAQGRDCGFRSSVICLARRGSISDQLERNEIDVRHMNMRSPLWFPAGLRRLRNWIRHSEPDVVQGWMYHGNLAASLACRRLAVPVAWNVRQSLHRPDLFKLATRLTIRANARYSRRVDSIIYNSQSSRRQHEAAGFCRDNAVWIPNGIDPQEYSVAAADSRAVRESIGIASTDLMVIAVGRAHPIKGYDILLRSVPEVILHCPDARFVVVGREASWEHDPFRRFVSNEVVRQNTTLLGERSDVPELLAAADLFVSSSRTEGFPNAVAEAMAMQLPCVVTDVGDSSLLLGDCGKVVPPGDADALAVAATALLQAGEAHRSALGASARTRIESEFSLTRITRRYADLYQRLVQDHSARETG